MKVKIVGCYKPPHWYENHIGEVFEAYFSEDLQLYYVSKRGYIEVFDCQVIEKPKQNNMKKKVYIQVQNEREFKSLMRYYERVKEWKWVSGYRPMETDYSTAFYAISFEDNFVWASECCTLTDEYKVIPFDVLAAIEGIEVEPERVKLDIDGIKVTISGKGGAIIIQDNSSVCLSSENIEQLYKAVKDYQSKL